MAPGLDFLKASAPDSARSEGGSSAQNTGRSGGSTARSDASGGGGGGGGGNIFGDAGKPRAKRGGLLGADANELAAETNNLQAYSTKAAEAKAKEEYQKSAAERKVRLMRIYSEMLAKAGIENKAAGKHLERLGNMNYSDKMQTGRLSERMYDDIRKERKFDRFNRPVRQKGSRQKALVANIKSQFMSKSDAREDDAEFVDPNSRRLKTAKWKIGYRKWVRAPPGLAESVVSVLNSDGNEDIFSWDGEWADGGMNGFGRFEFIDKNTFDGKMIKNVRTARPSQGTRMATSTASSSTASSRVRQDELRQRERVRRDLEKWEAPRQRHPHLSEWVHLQRGLAAREAARVRNGDQQGKKEESKRLCNPCQPARINQLSHVSLGRSVGRSIRFICCAQASKCSYRGHFAFGKVKTGFGALSVEDPPKSGKFKEVRQEFSFAYGASLRDVRNYIVAEWTREKQRKIDDRQSIFGLQEMVLIREQITEAREAIYKQRRDERQAVVDERRRLDQERRKKIKEKQQEQLASMSRMGGDEAA